MKDEIRCNDPQAACFVRRLSNFFHMNFRYDEADRYYRQIACVVNLAIPVDRQRTLERIAMEVLEAQKDLYGNTFAEEIQKILDSCAVKSQKLEDLSTWQKRQRRAPRRRALQAVKMQPVIASLERMLS
jgi:hypothetical protein